MGQTKIVLKDLYNALNRDEIALEVQEIEMI